VPAARAGAGLAAAGLAAAAEVFGLNKSPRLNLAGDADAVGLAAAAASFFCWRASPSVKRQATRRFQPRVSPGLSYVRGVFRVTAIGQAIRPGWETEPARLRRRQVRLQKREQQIW